MDSCYLASDRSIARTYWQLCVLAILKGGINDELYLKL